MRFNLITGSILVLAGIMGFFTVADDLRHVGELAGVAGILLAGLILLTGSFEHRLKKYLPVRWMAGGTLAGIIAGAAIDNMFPGIILGITAGTITGLTLLRKHRSEKQIRG